MKNAVIRFIESVSGRIGRWITIAVWIAIVAICSMVFPNVNSVTNNSAATIPTSSMSVQAENVSQKYFSNNNGTPILVVWYRKDGLTNADLQEVQDLYRHLKDKPLHYQKSLPPFAQMPVQALRQSISKDGTSLVTPIMMDESANQTELATSLDQLKTYLTDTQSPELFNSSLTTSGLHVSFTGPVAIASDAQALFGQANTTLLIATISLVLVLLIFLYRSPILAFIPLIGVGLVDGITGALLGGLAKHGIITVDSQSANIMTVLLFGAGTDYCLFLIASYRETLFKERDHFRALRLALHRSGGAIMVSALTIVVSLSTLLLAEFGTFQRSAVPFSLAILLMGIAALTLIPALLAIFGRIAFFPFIPRTEEMMKELEAKKGKPLKRIKTKVKFSTALGKLVSSKPWVVIITTVIVLGGLATFTPQIKTTEDLISTFPKTMPSREGYDLIAAHFSPGELAPVQVIVNTEGKSIDIKSTLNKLPYVESVGEPIQSSKDKNYESIMFNLKGDPYAQNR